MQKQAAILENDLSTFKINSNLDVEDSVYIARILFDYVEQGKLTFELSSKKGSVVSEFIVSVIGGVFSNILYDLAKKIYNKLKEEKQIGKIVKPVYIFLPDKQYIITGDESDKLPEK
jgi:hypothetical protein